MFSTRLLAVSLLLAGCTAPTNVAESSTEPDFVEPLSTRPYTVESFNETSTTWSNDYFVLISEVIQIPEAYTEGDLQTILADRFFVHRINHSANLGSVNVRFFELASERTLPCQSGFGVVSHEGNFYSYTHPGDYRAYKVNLISHSAPLASRQECVLGYLNYTFHLDSKFAAPRYNFYLEIKGQSVLIDKFFDGPARESIRVHLPQQRNVELYAEMYSGDWDTFRSYKFDIGTVNLDGAESNLVVSPQELSIAGTTIRERA